MADGLTPMEMEGSPVIEVIRAPSDVNDDLLRRFHQLWLDSHDGNRRPDKAFIDPFRLRFVIGSMVLVEVVPGDPVRFRYRLVGTDITDRIGAEITGKFLEEHPDKERIPLVRHTFMTTYTAEAPVVTRVNLRIYDRPWRYEAVIVPLFGADGSVTHLGGAQTFPPQAPRWRREPTA